MIKNSLQDQQRQQHRDGALLIVVLSEKPALSESPVASIADLEACTVPVATILTNPFIIDLTQGQPALKAAMTAIQLKARAKEFLSQQKVKSFIRSQR